MGIRKANPNTDLSSLIKIEHTCFNQGFSGATFFYFLKSESSPLYVYEDASGIQGYCLCTKDSEQGEVWIASLAVRPEAQRTGVGSRLVKHVIQCNSPSPLLLTCQSKAPALIAFYEKLGFSQIETLKDPYQDGSDRALLKFVHPES